MPGLRTEHKLYTLAKRQTNEPSVSIYHCSEKHRQCEQLIYNNTKLEKVNINILT